MEGLIKCHSTQGYSKVYLNGCLTVVNKVGIIGGVDRVRRAFLLMVVPAHNVEQPVTAKLAWFSTASQAADAETADLID